MRTVVRNGILLTPGQEVRDSALLIEDGRILGTEPARAVDREDLTIDAHGYRVVPGLIDLHVHGGGGYDTMDATPEAIQGIGRFIARHGVTAYLPTTVTASNEATLAAIENVGRTPTPFDGAEAKGVHLEGPYLSVDHRGAQPLRHLRTPVRDEYEAWFDTGHIRLMTAAPEVDGMQEMLQAGRAAGIEFAVGHSGASYEQVEAAVELGLRQVTHTFNGMAPLHHRTPGVLGAALSDGRLRCQIIADGVHVHPAAVKMLVNAKGAEGTILITDSVRATGMPDGDYTLGDEVIHVVDGVARTPAGGLAGSTLTMDRALRNMMAFSGLSLREVLPMATQTPAAAMGWQGRKGVLAAGADADVVILDNDCQVRLTMVSGHVIFDSLG